MFYLLKYLTTTKWDQQLSFERITPPQKKIVFKSMLFIIKNFIKNQIPFQINDFVITEN